MTVNAVRRARRRPRPPSLGADTARPRTPWRSARSSRPSSTARMHPAAGPRRPPLPRLPDPPDDRRAPELEGVGLRRRRPGHRPRGRWRRWRRVRPEPRCWPRPRRRRSSPPPRRRSPAGQPGSTARPVPVRRAGLGVARPAGCPSISSSALVQAASVNDRLRSPRRPFARPSPRPASTPRSSPRRSARSPPTRSTAEQLAGKIAALARLRGRGHDIGLAYDGIHDTAVEALVASVRTTTAYQAVGQRDAPLLAGRSAVDAADRGRRDGQRRHAPRGVARP